MPTAEGYDSFVQAKHYYVGRKKPVRLIVIHCTVSKEVGTGAEAVAQYFKNIDRRASAHCAIDSNSSVGCVHDGDTAFAAAGANSDGYHIEIVGMPDQTVDQWLDDFSRATLDRSADIARAKATKWSVPTRWLSVAEIRAGKAGFCTHEDISKAYPEVSTGHWDPGPNFPKQFFMNLVNKDQEDDDVPDANQVEAAKFQAVQQWYECYLQIEGFKIDPNGVRYWVGRCDVEPAHVVRKSFEALVPFFQK